MGHDYPEAIGMFFKILASLPFIGTLLGVPLANSVYPLFLGMPFVLGWIVICLVLSSIIMLIIYRLDSTNRVATPSEADPA
jgi:pilus assembly protein TadC